MRHALALLATLTLLAPQFGAAQSSGTLAGIKASETVRIGYRETEPPLSFLDHDQQPAGYSIDLCARIVAEVKRVLKNPNIATKFLPVKAATRFEALTSNKIDILCGSTTKTLSRSEKVDFTQLTFATGGSLLSLKSSSVDGIASLKGKKVAVVKGTTTIDALKKVLKESEVDAEVVAVDTAGEGVTALAEGEVAAFSADQVVLIGLVLTHEGPEDFALSSELFSFEPFALAVRRNDAEFRLLADRVLSKLNRSGEIVAIYKRWFGRFSEEVPTLVQALYMLNATPE
jgi:ABC-type amino acid transport substrate-binding protein